MQPFDRPGPLQFALALCVAIALPGAAAPAESLLELDSRGGYGRQRTGDEPYLAVLADGRVMRSGAEDASAVELCVLDDQELESLLHFVRVEHRLDAVDPEWLEQQVEAAREAEASASGPQPRIADLPTTIVRIRTEVGMVELTHRGLGRDARRFPHLSALSAMLELSERMQGLCSQEH